MSDGRVPVARRGPLTGLPLISRCPLLCFRFDAYRDVAPLLLLEANHTQPAPRHVTGKNRDPNVNRVQPACLPDHEADTEGYDDLRDDRNIERAPGVSRPLQSTRVGERDCDEKTRDAQHAQKLDADLDDGGLVHAEDGEQLSREGQEEESDERRAGEPEARRYAHRR